MFTKRNYLVGVIIFVAVWCVLLIVPNTRAVLVSQLWQISLYGISSPLKPYSETRAVTALAKRYPNDPQIQAILVQNISNYTTNTNYHLTHIHEYDKLIRRFPKAHWLISERLRESATKNFKSPAGAYYLKNNQRIYIESDNWMNYDELKQTLKISQLGQQRESNNSFFNWIEAMCHYSLGNNDKALDALQRGSYKTDFNDGTLQRLQNKLYVHRLSSHPLFEDKLIAWATPIMLHLQAIENVNRIAIWQGAKEETAGNHQKALAIYAAQMRLNFVMLTKSQQIITRLTAQHLLLETWEGFTRREQDISKSLGFVTTPNQQKVLLGVASEFANYASAHGHKELGRESMEIAEFICNDFGSPGEISTDFLMPVQLSTISQIAQLKWVGYELLAITLCCIALLFLFYIYNCLLNLAIRRDALFSFEKPLFSDIITCILFISATVILGIIITLRIAPSDANLFTPILSDQSLAASETPHSIFHILTRWVPRSVLLLLLFWNVISVLWQMRKSTFNYNQVPQITANKIVLIIRRLFFWILAFAFQIWWAKLILDQSVNSSALTSNILFVIVPLPLVLFLILKWYSQRSRKAHLITLYWNALAIRLQHSLALIIFTCTIAYSIISFASLPIRNKANTSIDTIIEKGEITALRERIKQANQSP